MKTQATLKLPLQLGDTLAYRDRSIPITLAIHEEGVLALLADEPDLFAQGKTIQEAKENLLRGLADELHFLHKHAGELGDDLQAQYKLLQRLLA